MKVHTTSIQDVTKTSQQFEQFGKSSPDVIENQSIKIAPKAAINVLYFVSTTEKLQGSLKLANNTSLQPL